MHSGFIGPWFIAHALLVDFNSMSHRCMANQYVVWDKYTLAITACFQPELPPQEWTYFWKKNLWRTLQHRRMGKIWTPRNTPSQHTTKPAGTTSSSHCANAEFGKVPASSFDGHSPGQRANKQHLFVGGQAMGMGEKKACTWGNRFIIHIRFERFFSFKEWFGSYRDVQIKLPWMLSYFPTPATSKIERAGKAKQTATAKNALRNTLNDQAAK